MSQWAEIRYLHRVEGVPKRDVARRLDLDVKTVRRALEAEEAPTKRRSSRRGCRLDDWRSDIEGFLKEEPKISAKRIARLLEPKTGRLPDRSVRQYVARLRGDLFVPEVFVHRTPILGDAIEFDFGESWAEVAGRRQKVKYLVATLPASNVYFAKAYAVERLECLLDGMSEALDWFGGVPRRAVLDNTSLAVRKVLPGRDRQENERFQAFRGEWVLHVDFCAPGKGWEKGSVERGVEYVRGLMFRPTPRVESFDELNALILEELDRDLDLRKLPDGRTAREALTAEREHLRPLPTRRPETCRIFPCVANKYGNVRVDQATYSVPTEHARRVVTCRLYHDRVEFARDEEVIARHARSFHAGAVVIDPMHVLPLLEHKHRAVGEATAIATWRLPLAFHELRERLRAEVRKPDQEWVRILRLMESHSMDDVEAAVRQALDRGSSRLSTVHLLLRQGIENEQLRPAPIELERVDLREIEVAAPKLEAWDVLLEGGRR